MTPPDWTRTTSAELADKGVLTIGDGYRAKNSELASDGLPFVRAANIKGGIDVAGADVLSHDSVSKAGEKVSRSGDTVFTSKGTVGRFAFVSAETPAFVYSPQLCYWRSRDRAQLDPRFLHYWLRGPDAWSQFAYLKGQTDMADYVSLGDQRKMSIVLPSQPEQRRIAGVLAALDQKIEHNRVLARRATEVADTMFEVLLAEAGDVERRPLSDVAAVHKAPIAPLASADELFEHFSIPAFDNGSRATVERGASMLSAKTRLPAGDVILLSKLNPATPRVWWPRPTGDKVAVCSPEFIVLVPKNGCPASFIYASLRRDGPLYDEILSHATGTTGSRQRVKPSEVMSCRVAFAPDSWSEFDRVARPLHDLAAAVDRESATLATTRDLLLPHLVTGRIRVPDSYDPEDVLGTVVEQAAEIDPAQTDQLDGATHRDRGDADLEEAVV